MSQAGATGFEPAISCLTARHVEPDRRPALVPLPYLRPTRPGVHRRDEREVGGEGEGALGPADGHRPVVIRAWLRLAAEADDL